MGLLILWKLENSIYLTNEKTNRNNLWDNIYEDSAILFFVIWLLP